MSATSHEAPYVLDGLLHHGTLLKIDTHYTDTGGASDHVFILCALLGFRFCPRLRDLPERKLACIAPASTYPDLQPLLGQRIKVDLIREHWSETICLFASLKAGIVAPSTLLRKLAAYRRQNQLDLALQELGRIKRTLFMLDWLESPELRRCCHAGLNKKRAASFPGAGHLHLQAGRIADRRHRGAAISRLRPQPRHRRNRVLEHHLHRRRHRASAHDRKTAARRLARSCIAP
jgi:TnpA family transposase